MPIASDADAVEQLRHRSGGFPALPRFHGMV
jgi:hypothetical protein